ncbi:hypothetical protein [Saccharothrix obliqua]|uniref:hypothetical protein n=1 Tax=Saccharothrix obliqua TaxID=2861747 RepID=UPI001C5D0F0F|nr:hypothetical protein [Saccharothrix obliqua]MBW4721567.1 hypothetical protein [Saccharothrix obliqua]
MDRRDLLTAGLLASAYSLPLSRWLTERDPVSTTGPGPRVGRADIDHLTATAARIRAADSRYGGGSRRDVLLNTALVQRATPLLHGTYTDLVGRRLFSAVAELARQTGWSAFDAGYQELAQRHFAHALRLARVAGDIGLGCYILACMGLQATLRGHHATALHILEAATTRAHHHATPRTAAFCELIHARVHARAHDQPRALHAFANAEILLQRAADDDPEWIRFFGHPRLAADAVEIHRDLSLPRHARRWNDLTTDNSTHTRSHALRHIVLADTHLQGSVDLDLALHHATTARTLLDDVTSARAATYLTDLRRHLAPWNDHPPVAAYLA